MLEWIPDGEGVSENRFQSSYSADRLVIAAGAWTRGFLRDLELPLAVERQVVFWLDPG